MNTDVVIVCPACEQSVIPTKRRAPSVKVTTENGSTPYSAPSIGFGWFCPNDSCKCRLDKQVEQAQQEAAADEPKVEVLPDETEQKEPKPTPKLVKVPPVKQVEKVDLFAQIRQAHDRAKSEERDLTERLTKVREEREKLDRLIRAMDGMEPEVVAAE
jgi:hypothetical protein